MAKGQVMNDILQSAIKGKSKAGKTFSISYLKGKRLTQRQAIKAKCYDCNGMGESGICDIDTCSLFPYSPYRRSGHKALCVQGSIALQENHAGEGV